MNLEDIIVGRGFDFALTSPEEQEMKSKIMLEKISKFEKIKKNTIKVYGYNKNKKYF